MDKKEIERLIRKKELTITDVIDVVIGINGYVGVGLITLGDNLKNYCHKHAGASRGAVFAEKGE